MNVSRIGRRLATAGVTTALAAGALVGASATSATAASGTNDYTCNVPVLGTQTIPMKVDVPVLDVASTLPAGTFFDTGALDVLSHGPAVTLTFTLPQAMASVLPPVTALTSSDLAMGFGPGSVPVSGLAMTGITPGDAGTAIMTATGTNGAFSAPQAGSYAITMPQTFTMVPTVTGMGDLPITCSTATPATIKTVTLTKSDATTAVTSYTKTVKKGKHGSVSVKVDAGKPLMPTGTVKAFEGTKKVGTGTLTNGVAKVKLSLLSVGKHKITVKYLGDGFYNAGKKVSVGTVKVTR